MLTTTEAAGKPCANGNGEATAIRTVRKRVASLKPSPENRELYDPVNVNDPDFVKLADSIRRNGPHVITKDRYIVSGHRRHAALTLHGVKQTTCRVLPRKR